MEMLRGMNEGIYPGLFTIMEAVAWITLLFAAAAWLISLASIAWLCFKEYGKASRRHRKPALSAPNTNQKGRLIADASHSGGRTNFSSSVS